MKKVLCLSMLSFLLVGCGGNGGSGESTRKENKNSKELQEVQSEIDQSEIEGTQVEKTKEEKKYIDKEELIVVDDFAEITIINTYFSKNIEPPNPGSFYTYYEAKDEGTVYLDTVITIKSLLTTGKTSDEFLSVKVMFDDKYEYQTFSTIEEHGGSDFTYTNITSLEPLKVGNLHFLAEVPDEVESGSEPLVILVTANGQDYYHKVR